MMPYSELATSLVTRLTTGKNLLCFGADDLQSFLASAGGSIQSPSHAPSKTSFQSPLSCDSKSAAPVQIGRSGGENEISLSVGRSFIFTKNELNFFFWN